MSDSLADLLLTDAMLDLVAARVDDASFDVVLADLAALAAAVDGPADPSPVPASVRPTATAHKGGWAVSIAVGLMVASTGVAAAVSANPLAPLHYVFGTVLRMQPHDHGRLPGWELNGSMPITRVPVEVGPQRPRTGQRHARVVADSHRAESAAVRTSVGTPNHVPAGGPGNPGQTPRGQGANGRSNRVGPARHGEAGGARIRPGGSGLSGPVDAAASTHPTTRRSGFLLPARRYVTRKQLRSVRRLTIAATAPRRSAHEPAAATSPADSVALPVWRRRSDASGIGASPLDSMKPWIAWTTSPPRSPASG
jgi:hypothetical protein